MGIIKLSIKQMPCHCAAVFKAEAREQLIAALEPFQTAFLGKSLARLYEFVNSIFPTAARGSLPTQEHITRLVSHIHQELDATKSDKRLTLLVLHEVSKVLHVAQVLLYVYVQRYTYICIYDINLDIG